jgi:hypothetical protein
LLAKLRRAFQVVLSKLLQNGSFRERYGYDKQPFNSSTGAVTRLFNGSMRQSRRAICR